MLKPCDDYFGHITSECRNPTICHTSKETGTVTCKPENTPMDLNLRLINWGSSPIDSGMYQYLMRRLV